MRTIGIAVAVPEPHGAELQAWRERFGDPLARAIPTHVTLLPPTEVGAGDLEAIEQHLLTVASATDPFELRLEGTGSFRPVSDVVFVRVVGGGSELAELGSQVRSGPLLHELRFPFHPHVTIAHDLATDVLDDAERALAGYAAAVQVPGFSLYEHGADGMWRPQRDFVFGHALPGPVLPV